MIVSAILVGIPDDEGWPLSIAKSITKYVATKSAIIMHTAKIASNLDMYLAVSRRHRRNREDCPPAFATTIGIAAYLCCVFGRVPNC